MHICDLFDKYRDKELGAAEQREFESHMDSCEDCRMKRALLDHVVFLVRNEEVRPVDMADVIARRAFSRRATWASDVISWLRPVPAMAVLTLTLVLFSSLLMLSGNGKASLYSQYEQLLEEASGDNLVAGDNIIVDWMEQEGDSQ